MSDTARRYAGQSAQERDDQRRARLRAACRELVGSRGYAQTTVERLCQTAGVSTRHFYLHFSGKEAVFTDLYESIAAASFEAAAASLAQSAERPMGERVSEAFLAYLRPMVVDVRTARIVFVEIMGVSAQFEERRLAFREALVELVTSEGEAAVARGEIAARDFRVAAVALAGAASSVVYDWTRRDPRPPAAVLEESLAQLARTLLA